MKILNLNCWIFFSPFSYKNKERLDSLIKFIKKTNPEIINLQEIWLNKYVRYLQAHLKKYYFSYSKSKTINKTGLVTLTKMKPIYSEINYYPITKNHNWTELIFNKGYLKTIIQFKTKKLKIINTHLYAPFHKSIKKITRAQFKIIMKELGENTLLCGDFNLNPSEIKDLDRKALILTKGQITYSDQNPYTKKAFNKFMLNKNESIDHIITKSWRIKGKYKLIKSPIFSDHYAILADMNL